MAREWEEHWTRRVTGDTVGIVYCTTHAEKKVRNNLHKSFYSTAKRRLLVPALIEFGETDGAAEPASWQTVVDVVEHFKDFVRQASDIGH